MSLSPERRYLHFVRRVADMEELWALRSPEGWVVAGSPGPIEAIPVWPHAQYAADCAREQWIGSVPASITLGDWLGKWTPGLIRDSRLVAVFPSVENEGVIVSPARLQQDLETELQNYEPC